MSMFLGLGYPPRPMTPADKRNSRNRNASSQRHKESRYAEHRGSKETSIGPTRRGAVVKIDHKASKAIANGHPWVFREALVREPSGIATGKTVAVIDGDGRALGWGIFDAEGSIAIRMLSTLPDFTWNRREMTARVEASLLHRKQHGPKDCEQSIRLIHGESDGFPGIAVDRLGDFLLIYKYAISAESYLDSLVSILSEVSGAKGIYMQDRIRPVESHDRRPPAFHMWGEKAVGEFEIEEDGLRFWVDITAPVSPGLFLDLREGRRLLESLAKDREVLNLFSYTGAFALRAIRGGAKSVTNIDSAARSHARCRKNLESSGMDPESCEAIGGDVFKHLERFRQRDRLFDIVVVDPPPFSNVSGSAFSALRDWNELMLAVTKVVRPGGMVLAICNAAGLSDLEFLNAIGKGCQSIGRNVRLIGESGLPVDFPVLPAFQEGRYLKVKLLHLPAS